MKKVLFIAVAAAAILGLSSCKQSTCTCEEFYSGEILTGIELKTQYNNSTIDILGYNIDHTKMIQYLDECYGSLARGRIQEVQLEELGIKIKE